MCTYWPSHVRNGGKKRPTKLFFLIFRPSSVESPPKIHRRHFLPPSLPPSPRQHTNLPAHWMHLPSWELIIFFPIYLEAGHAVFATHSMALEWAATSFPSTQQALYGNSLHQMPTTSSAATTNLRCKNGLDSCITIDPFASGGWLFTSMGVRTPTNPSIFPWGKNSLRLGLQHIV